MNLFGKKTCGLNMYLIVFVFVLGILFMIQTTPLSMNASSYYLEGLENMNEETNNENLTKHLDSDSKDKKQEDELNELKLINEEGSTTSSKCPNMLIKDGNKIILYNSKKVKVPGVNPIEFNNLEEYAEFVEYLRAQNIKCPILYYEKMIDVQGDEVYKIESSPFTSDAGPQLDYVSKVGYDKHIDDASRDEPPYNVNSFPGFDGSNQRVGKLTPLNNIPSQ